MTIEKQARPLRPLGYKAYGLAAILAGMLVAFALIGLARGQTTAPSRDASFRYGGPGDLLALPK